MKLKFDTSDLHIEIEQDVLSLIPSLSQSSGDNERGGVIMGELYPNKNMVKVTHIIESKNVVSNVVEFELDVKYIQEHIDSIWKSSGGTITYLGDWHTHPENTPNPSFVDYCTFSKNYYKSKIDQNFLLYIILGYEKGDDTFTWIGVCNGLKTKQLHLKEIIYDRR